MAKEAPYGAAASVYKEWKTEDCVDCDAYHLFMRVAARCIPSLSFAGGHSDGVFAEAD
jgi:hypothetical protein